MSHAAPTTAAARRASARAALALALAASLLGGCALLPSASPDTAAGRVSVFYETFVVTGRLAVNRGTEGFSGNFHWRASRDADEIDLLSPFGQVIARMTSAAGRVRFVSAEGRIEEADSWETLTAREFGWPLPVAGLRYWIQGATRPGAPFADVKDDRGRRAELQQDGWTIAYRYHDSDPADARPALLRLTVLDVEVRIALDRWD